MIGRQRPSMAPTRDYDTLRHAHSPPPPHADVRGSQRARHPFNRPDPLAPFPTPAALQEMLARAFEAACSWFGATPNQLSYLRPYQVEANTAIEQAIAGRKRQMLVAMATGT